jgi:hypothetical protein
MTADPGGSGSGSTTLAYATEDFPHGSSMLSEYRVNVHAGNSNSRPSDHELSALTKRLASRALVVSLGRLLYKAPSSGSLVLVLHLGIENYRLP